MPSSGCSIWRTPYDSGNPALWRGFPFRRKYAARLARNTKTAYRLGAVYAGTQKGFERMQAKLTERDQLLGSAKQALCHLLHNIKISGTRIDLGLAKDSADTVITLINALQAEAKP